MRWRKKSLNNMVDRLVELGVMPRCAICGSETMSVIRRPAQIRIGGPHYGKGDPRNDPEANELFMVLVHCEVCGAAHFFNSEKLVPRDERMIIVGLTEEEEEERERREAEGEG